MAKSLRVQAGDEVHMEVYGKYIQPSAGAQNTNALALIAAPLLQAFGVPVPPEGLSVLQTTASDIAAGGVFLNKAPDDPTVQAYMNYLLFDDDFVFKSAGFIMLSEAAKVTGPETQHERLSIDLPIAEDGYLYTYLSNESSKVAEVYFDDYKITHRKLVPDVAYGTEAVAYRYGFNGKEKDQSGEWGLTAYDYGFRIYNPALGRFLSVDPLTKSYPMLTPYQYASNRPIDGIDLDGLEHLSFQFVVETQARSEIQKKGDKEVLADFDEAMRKINGAQLAVALIPNAIALDLYLTRGKVTENLVKQYATQLTIRSSIELYKVGFEGQELSVGFQNALTKSLEGVDGADGVISVITQALGGKYATEAANVFNAMIDFNYNKEKGEFELNSLVTGKGIDEVLIDYAGNKLNDYVGDQIPDTKISGIAKEEAGGLIGEVSNYVKKQYKNFMDFIENNSERRINPGPAPGVER